MGKRQTYLAATSQLTTTVANVDQGLTLFNIKAGRRVLCAGTTLARSITKLHSHSRLPLQHSHGAGLCAISAAVYFFHNKRHSGELNSTHVSAFLTHLAVERDDSASTQKQALCAIVFLYRDVSAQNFGRLGRRWFGRQGQPGYPLC